MGATVSTHTQGPLTTLAVAGELDLASSDMVTRAISRALDAPDTRAVTVDLTMLQFLDSSGISVLLKGRRAADKAGLAYRVVGVTGTVRQVLDLTGVLDHLTGQPRPPDGERPEPDNGDAGRFSPPDTGP